MYSCPHHANCEPVRSPFLSSVSSFCFFPPALNRRRAIRTRAGSRRQRRLGPEVSPSAAVSRSAFSRSAELPPRRFTARWKLGMHSQWRSDLNMLNSREKEVKKKGKTPTTCPKSRSEDSTSPATRGTPKTSSVPGLRSRCALHARCSGVHPVSVTESKALRPCPERPERRG